jgi:hypothetical protein
MLADLCQINVIKNQFISICIAVVPSGARVVSIPALNQSNTVALSFDDI